MDSLKLEEIVKSKCDYFLGEYGETIYFLALPVRANEILSKYEYKVEDIRLADYDRLVSLPLESNFPLFADHPPFQYGLTLENLDKVAIMPDELETTRFVKKFFASKEKYDIWTLQSEAKKYVRKKKN